MPKKSRYSLVYRLSPERVDKLEILRQSVNASTREYTLDALIDFMFLMFVQSQSSGIDLKGGDE